MAVGCGASCARIMLIIFNIVFWLSGAALLGFGIYLLVDKSVLQYISVVEALGEDGPLVKYASYVIIAVGAFVLVVGFLGCCGALKEIRWMLGIYIALLVVVMLAEIAAGVLGIIFKDRIIEEGDDLFREQLGKKYVKEADNDPNFSAAFKEGVDFIQYEFECCGWAGPVDYKKTTPPLRDANGQDIVPITCCKLKPDVRENSDTKVTDLETSDAVNYAQCQIDYRTAMTTATDFYIAKSCRDDLVDWIEENAVILIGVGIGVACLELFGFIFAVCLCRNIED